VAVTRRVIVEALMVEGFIDSLNDTVTVLLRSTSAAPFVGTTDTTVGGVMSAVVNVVEKGDASEFPSTSRTPVVTARVYPVEPDSDADGVNVAVVVAAV
jgi:hypothetical protein